MIGTPVVGKKIPDFDYFEAQPEEINTYSWSPSPPGVAGQATQVHLLFPLGEARIIFRFKGPNTLDRLIAALQDHRRDVWGDP